MPEIQVDLSSSPAHRYIVRIDSGLLGRLGEIVRDTAPAKSCAVMTDRTVADLYLATALQSLQAAGFTVTPFVFPAGESFKTLATVSNAYDVLISARLERQSPIIALGGGVVGDLTGFVAATLLRGVPFVQVPTTLLAAVDASVGGKVGVDHPLGKNLIGAFHQPRMVLMDVQTLPTLPRVELQCGLAECVKHAIIRDADLFDFIDNNLPAIFSSDPRVLSDLVAWNIRIKATIVMEDPFENGVRAILNLGHSFGHALETVAGYTGLKHGQAVALGTIAATNMAIHRGILDIVSHARIKGLLEKIGLLANPPRIDPSAAMQMMYNDKKIRDGKLRIILPTSIGSAEIIADARPEEILAAMASIVSRNSGGV